MHFCTGQTGINEKQTDAAWRCQGESKSGEKDDTTGGTKK